jgi:hypothetical protein
LFFNARILRPASVVAAPFTCACSEIVAGDVPRDVVKEWKSASWGMVYCRCWRSFDTGRRWERVFDRGWNRLAIFALIPKVMSV